MIRAALRLAAGALALAALTPAAARHGELPVSKADKVLYNKGVWTAYAAPWCATTYPSLNGQFVDSIVVRPSSFPANTAINYSWPAATSPCGVYGFIDLSFGNYDGAYTSTVVTPKTVNALSTMLEEVDLAQTGNVSNGILNEFYLTTAQLANGAGVSGAASMTAEVGWELHLSANGVSYFNSSTQLGTYTDRYGQVWAVSQAKSGVNANSPYFMIARSGLGDFTRGQIDMLAGLNFLKGLGKITGAEYVNGIGLGVEPNGGSGTLQVNRWTVVYN